jgi:phosphoglycerate dehydrogenase-like enzyme
LENIYVRSSEMVRQMFNVLRLAPTTPHMAAAKAVAKSKTGRVVVNDVRGWATAGGAVNR